MLRSWVHCCGSRVEAADTPLRHTDRQALQAGSLACSERTARGSGIDMFMSFNAVSAVVSVSRVHHRWVENGEFAVASIPDWLDICSRTLSVSTRQLTEGFCSAAGGIAADEEFIQQAGLAAH